MKILSRIFVFSFFLLSIFYFLSSAALVNAASKTTPVQPEIATASSNTFSDIPNNPHYSTQNTVIEILSAVQCQLTGIDPINPKQPCLGADLKTGKIGFLSSPKTGGAIGAMGNLITILYTPPLHTVDYFQNLAQNFGLAKKAYAQTPTPWTGFEGLRPLMGLWTAFRNIVYLIFVIVFVVIGLAIMLRIKIDPRTVMTIQNQIPKIIVGILLVTFSYAISGFLIDMMYTMIYITGNVIVSAPTETKTDPATVVKITSASNPFVATSRSVGLTTAFKSSTAIGGEIKEIFETPGGRIFTTIVGGASGGLISSAITNSMKRTIAGSTSLIDRVIKRGAPLLPFLGAVTGPAGAVAGFAISAIIGGAAGFIMGPVIVSGIATLIVFLILTIALFAALFRLWFTLLMAYIQILLGVVLAPFWIIGGIIPGSPINISGWLRSMAANLLAFPVVIAMFLLGKVFQDAMGNGGVNNFVPPLIGDRISAEAVKGFISLGIVLITPNILNLLKAAFKNPKTDLGIGRAIGSGTGTLTSPFKHVITGFTFLAGQRAAQNLPIVGSYLKGDQLGNQRALKETQDVPKTTR